VALTEHPHHYLQHPNKSHLPAGIRNVGREPVLIAYIPQQIFSDLTTLHARLGVDRGQRELSLFGLEYAVASSIKGIDCTRMCNTRFTQPYHTSSVSCVNPAIRPSDFRRVLTAAGVHTDALIGLYKYTTSLESTTASINYAIDAAPNRRRNPPVVVTDHINLIWKGADHDQFDPSQDVGVMSNDNSPIRDGSTHTPRTCPFGWLKAHYPILQEIHTTLRFLEDPSNNPSPVAPRTGKVNTSSHSKKHALINPDDASDHSSKGARPSQDTPSFRDVVSNPANPTQHQPTSSYGGGLTNSQLIDVQAVFRSEISVIRDEHAASQRQMLGLINQLSNTMQAMERRLLDAPYNPAEQPRSHHRQRDGRQQSQIGDIRPPNDDKTQR
jgi:hypothetical protein